MERRLPHDRHAKRLAPDDGTHRIIRRRLRLKIKPNAGPSSSRNPLERGVPPPKVYRHECQDQVV